MVGLLRPEDLKMIASDAEMAEVGKEDRLKKQKAHKKQTSGSIHVAPSRA